MDAHAWHHRKLDVWQKSMDMVTRIYSLTKGLPASERFGLYSQMRRAAISIPTNIAEGAARGTSKEFARFLMIARGSLAELETQLDIVKRLQFIEIDPDLVRQTTAVRQMLTGLIRKMS